MSEPWNAGNDQVVAWIRDAGSCVEVSRDLRHRLLDRAQGQLREDRAWGRAFFVCLLFSLMVTVVGHWTHRWATVQATTTAASRWSVELRRIDSPAHAAGQEVLSWSGWTPRRPDDSTR